MGQDIVTNEDGLDARGSSGSGDHAKRGGEVRVPPLHDQLVCAERSNPARGPIRVLTPTGGAVHVFDVSGRTIARVPIAGRVGTWNLRDASGRRVPGGVYFLLTADGTSARVTVLR